MKRILLILLVAVAVIWIVSPDALTNISDLVKAKVSEKTKTESEKAVLGIKTRINKALLAKSQELLGNNIQIQLPSKPEAEVVTNVPDKENKNIVLIDYLTQRNIKLELKLGTDYYLDLRNVPSDLCLFVNKESYPLLKNEYLKIRFDKGGEYDLYFERCEAEKFGQIIVQ